MANCTKIDGPGDTVFFPGTSFTIQYLRRGKYTGDLLASNLISELLYFQLQGSQSLVNAKQSLLEGI